MNPGKKQAVLAIIAVAGIAAAAAFFIPQNRPHAALTEDGEERAALEELERVTPEPLPDATVTMMAGKATGALKKRDFDHAVKIAMALAHLRGATPDQHVLVKNTIQNVKLYLAEAAGSGDTNALAAIELFKKSSPAGR